MKINIIGGNAYSSTGGIQAVNRFVVRELAANGVLGTAFFLWDDLGSATREGVELQQRGVVSFFGLDRWKFIFSLFRHSILHPNDLWLCTHVNYGLLTLLVAFLQRKRVAIMIYAAELDTEFVFLKRFALRRFRMIIAISNFTKRKAIRFGVKPENIHVMLLGTHDPRPDFQPDDSRSQSDNILFVGRMDERYKGQSELLDAMIILRHRHPRLRLIFVGGGRTLAEWKADAEGRGLSDVVSFTGRISDENLNAAYRNATIFAMPSENEGFGLVYTEAMAHGAVCIAGDVDAACEVIRDKETGICVPARNSVALAAAIDELLRYPELRRKMALAGRRRFEQVFDEERYRRRFLCEIEEWCKLAGT